MCLPFFRNFTKMNKMLSITTLREKQTDKPIIIKHLSPGSEKRCPLGIKAPKWNNNDNDNKEHFQLPENT